MRPVAIYGANGFTGSRAARELAARGVPLVLAGRNRAALEGLAEELDGDVETRRIELGDAAAIRRLAGDAGVLINNAPLFVNTGPVMVRAAIEGGAHYVDPSAEQRFLHHLIEHEADRAAAAGVALLPGFAFTHALGDMLAHLAAEGLGPAAEITVGYHAERWRPTEGSIHARLDGIGGTWFTYDGGLRRTTAVQSPGWFSFPDPVGRVRVVAFPLCEVLSVPRHVDAQRVRVVLNIENVIDPRLGRVYRPLTATSRMLMRTPAARVVEAILRRQWGQSTEADRSEFTIVARARAGGQMRTAGLRAREIYSVTALLQAEAAFRALDPAFAVRGLPAPAEAFEPAEFLHWLERRASRAYGVTHWVDAEVPVAA